MRAEVSVLSLTRSALILPEYPRGGKSGKASQSNRDLQLSCKKDLELSLSGKRVRAWESHRMRWWRYIYAKEPCIHAKEACIHAKEAYLPSIWCKRALYTRKRALHTRKRALHTRKRGLSTIYMVAEHQSVLSRAPLWWEGVHSWHSDAAILVWEREHHRVGNQKT